MHTIQWQKMRQNILMVTAVAATMSVPAAASARDRDPSLDWDVRAALHECKQITSSCADATKDAVGILVFPHVVKADLIVGGAGGQGALIEHGKITGYYNLASGSAGLQAGIQKSSQVYVFRTQDALDQLKEGQDWKVGANAGVTFVNADTNVHAASGDVLAYVFDAQGLHAGAALEVFDVWKSGEMRPS